VCRKPTKEKLTKTKKKTVIFVETTRKTFGGREQPRKTAGNFVETAGNREY